MIHLSEPVILIELEQNRYNLCARHLQVIVKSHGQHTYLQETMKSFKPKFYEKLTTFVSSFMLQALYFHVFR